MLKFNKLVLAFLSLSFLVSCVRVQNVEIPRYISDQHHVDHVLHSVVGLVEPSRTHPGTLHAFCTGFFINPTTIVTARHCVLTEEAQLLSSFGLPPTEIVGRQIDFITYDQELHMLSTEAQPTPHHTHVLAIGADEDHDSAVLRLDTTESPAVEWLTVDNSLPRMGQSVFTIGLPAGLPWVMADGIISQVIHISENGSTTEFIMTNIAIWHGSSGGPLVSNNGTVIGIVKGSLREQSNINIWTPISYATSLIPSH